MLKKMVLIVWTLIVCNLLQAQDPKMNAFIGKLMKQMTLEEKACQMVTLYGFGRVLKDEFPTK